MKNIFILYVAPVWLAAYLFLLQQNINNTHHYSVAATADTTTWIGSLGKLRDAAYKKDKQKVKTFFSFPIMNEANEIWFLVYSNEKQIAALPQKIKPFTEKDFDKYYSKIITPEFITALLKINTGQLYKKGNAQTAELKLDKSTTYKMYAAFDKTAKLLSLNIAYNTISKDEKGEVLDGGEHNIIYQFKVAGGKIVFKQIRIAG